MPSTPFPADGTGHNATQVVVTVQCDVVSDPDPVGEIEEPTQIETENPLVVRREILDLESIDARSIGDAMEEELLGRQFVEPDLGPDLRLKHLTVP
jgi:hypothetical protein